MNMVQAQRAVDNWINSPGHFETMIDPRCDCIGVGVTQYDGITYWFLPLRWRLSGVPHCMGRSDGKRNAPLQCQTPCSPFRDAEECVNDAYLGAWNAIPPVHPNPLLSYIVKIVRNISLKIYFSIKYCLIFSRIRVSRTEMFFSESPTNSIDVVFAAKTVVYR